MNSDWQAYAVAIVALGIVYSIVFLLPALLVRFKIVTTNEPVVSKRMPAIRDWALTACNLLAALALIVIKDPTDSIVLAAVVIYFIGMPWWIWRSVKGILYYRQSGNSLSPAQVMSIVVTNMFFYALIASLFTGLHHA